MNRAGVNGLVDRLASFFAARRAFDRLAKPVVAPHRLAQMDARQCGKLGWLLAFAVDSFEVRTLLQVAVQRRLAFAAVQIVRTDIATAAITVVGTDNLELEQSCHE
jgi:hypothetical protein